MKLGNYECIELKSHGYTLRVVPQLGGQVIALEKNGLSALHEPVSQEALDQASTSYGLPILFPPNRIDGGHFKTEAREYQFKINEPNRGNSLHGFLHYRPWKVSKLSENEMTVTFEADEESGFYEDYPHAFRVDMVYRLSEEGLYQETIVENKSTEPMPLGLGFHTAFSVEEDTKVFLSVGERIEMSERMLPTKVVRPLNEKEICLREGGLQPTAWSMDDHYTASPLKRGDAAYHGAIVERKAGTVYYEVDPFYQHWMIWNADQEGSFICLEPQNWRVNAPNLVTEGMPEAEAGTKLLQPGETFAAWSRIRVENK